MKIILEEREKNLIDNINKDIEENKDVPLLINKKGGKYYLEFECDDIVKASVFAAQMMGPNIQTIDNIRETLGINIIAFSYSNPQGRSIENLKNVLRETLNTLENL